MSGKKKFSVEQFYDDENLIEGYGYNDEIEGEGRKARLPYTAPVWNTRIKALKQAEKQASTKSEQKHRKEELTDQFLKIARDRGYDIADKEVRGFIKEAVKEKMGIEKPIFKPEKTVEVKEKLSKKDFAKLFGKGVNDIIGNRTGQGLTNQTSLRKGFYGQGATGGMPPKENTDEKKQKRLQKKMDEKMKEIVEKYEGKPLELDPKIKTEKQINKRLNEGEKKLRNMRDFFFQDKLDLDLLHI